jgi:lipopolysaccharide export system protein LptA
MSPRNNKRLLSAACLCGLAVAGSAWALKTDKYQPVNVHSDHGDFKADPNNTSNGTGIYTGHVVITQGSIVITADKAVLHIIDNELDTADFTGNPATFLQKPDQGQPMHGESLEITYNASQNEIVLITSAKLTQQVLEISGKGIDRIAVPGQRLMTAQRIRYNTDTQHVIAIAKAGDISKTGDEAQRVHISFPPKIAPPSITEAGPVVVPDSDTAQPATPASTHAPAVPAVLMPRSATAPAPAAATTMPRPSTAPAAATTPPPSSRTGAP